VSEQPTPDQIMQVGLGFWASKTLLSAVEMELFTELAKHPEDAEALRDRLGLHPRSSLDFLDALVALGFIERRDGIYSNTPSTDLFLDKRKPSYVGGLLEMANHRLYGFWGNLTQALRTGRLQNEAASGETPFFEALYADPARLKQFLTAMSGLSHGANLAIAQQFPWNEARPSQMSGRRKATSLCRSRSPTHTSPVSVSTCPRSPPCSRSSSSTRACREDCSS
jgi:Dimerisation domain